MELNTIYKQKVKQDYYSVLEVSKEANKQELRKSRRKLLAKYHPDKFSGDDKKTCEKIASLINDAYEALSDETFRENYDKSGCKLRYTISNEPEIKKRKKREQQVVTRGISLVAIARLSSEVLQKGGTVEVSHRPVGNKDMGNPKRVIEVKPNTKHDSYHVYQGLGEQIANGESGDLIVLFQCSDALTGNNKLRTQLTPDIIFVPNNKVLPEGTHKLDIAPLLENEVEVRKTKNTKSLLYIKEADKLNKSLLIKY